MHTLLLQRNRGREGVVGMRAVQWAVSGGHAGAGGEGAALVSRPFSMAELWKELGNRRL